MSRTKNRSQKHKPPVLTIKHRDGSLTEVVPAKAWNPGAFFTAHVDNTAMPETLQALSEAAQIALNSVLDGSHKDIP